MRFREVGKGPGSQGWRKPWGERTGTPGRRCSFQSHRGQGLWPSSGAWEEALTLISVRVLGRIPWTTSRPLG